MRKMPNWVTSKITGKDAEKVIGLLKDATAECGYSLGRIIPMPEDVYRGDLGEEEEKLYPGDRNWYGWSCRHWGTKWDLCHPLADAAEHCYLYFDTAWNAPVPVFDRLAETHPELCFTVKYCDEDYNGGNRGALSYAGGRMVEDRDLTKNEVCDLIGVSAEEVDAEEQD